MYACCPVAFPERLERAVATSKTWEPAGGGSGMDDLIAVRKARSLLDEATLSRHALERARELYEDRLAPEFSPFEFLGTDELIWSQLIGWLLNPKGSHAQKGRFLRLFTRHVSHIGREWPEHACETAVLELEHRFDGGRIDILIRSGDRLLIIENKPSAADQDAQLARYFAYADGRTRERLKTVIVYLTADGRGPAAHSLDDTDVEARRSDGTLVLQSYRELSLASDSGGRSWLDVCRHACRSPRVAGFIEDMQNRINMDFSGIRDMNAVAHLADAISKSPEDIKSAFQIAQSLNLLRAKLCTALIGQIKYKASAHNIHLSENSSIQANGLYLNFEFDPQSPYLIRFYTSDVVAIGLLRRDENDSKDQAQIAIGRNLARRLNGLGPSKNWGGDKWAWIVLLDANSPLCALPRDFWMNPAPWASIAAEDGHDGQGDLDVAEKIVGAVRRIQDALTGVQQGPAVSAGP
ncbi:MAG: hypothetical protein B7Y12_07805 [Rhizobiales bacterium 24-66-13]|nr:MAG: hypothetical protein B7Y61_03070 [Rhizobiales bacterium 35-66-30]OYZ80727.1 MAG: hypothetical protein B7Y12_07805 [Rhizobiales bacterium 24-66-13]OZB07081.1 MAG: hypothetical protein B7X67_09375 [Rhizobiales bacterium 39-66-18]